VRAVVGTDADLSLRGMMSKRAAIMGTVLQVQPLDQKAVAVQAFAHSVGPLRADRRLQPVVDRVFPVEQVVEAFDHLAAPGTLARCCWCFPHER
jgi:NADPH:quinone reductase-like Zn-dependent oxidoreductase